MDWICFDKISFRQDLQDKNIIESHDNEHVPIVVESELKNLAVKVT
jgi:hypothetical protein